METVVPYTWHAAQKAGVVKQWRPALPGGECSPLCQSDAMACRDRFTAAHAGVTGMGLRNIRHVGHWVKQSVNQIRIGVGASVG